MRFLQIFSVRRMMRGIVLVCERLQALRMLAIHFSFASP